MKAQMLKCSNEAFFVSLLDVVNKENIWCFEREKQPYCKWWQIRILQHVVCLMAIPFQRCAARQYGTVKRNEEWKKGRKLSTLLIGDTGSRPTPRIKHTGSRRLHVQTIWGVDDSTYKPYWESPQSANKTYRSHPTPRINHTGSHPA